MSLKGLQSVSGLLTKSEAADAGKPLQLDISLVDDDPENREDTSEEALQELAEDIKERGVKTPVSVRNHPEIAGRYMLNYGHRRKAASIIAGKTTIPAWIDNEFEDYDQIKENLLSEALSPRDTAKFIQKKLNQGEQKGVIAKKLGKSPAFVTQYASLLALPDSINLAFEQGRCVDVTVINNLTSMYKKHPEEVDNWLADEEQDITRNSLSMLKSYIKDKQNPAENPSDDTGTQPDEKPEPDKKGKQSKESDPTKLKKAIVLVEYQGREARLMPNIRPTMKGTGFIKFEDDGEEIEIELGTLKMLEIIEG